MFAFAPAFRSTRRRTIPANVRRAFGRILLTIMWETEGDGRADLLPYDTETPLISKANTSKS